MTRACGGCTACCKLLPMARDQGGRVVETIQKMVTHGLATYEEFQGMREDFHKPAGKPCPYQKHRKGCTIYKARPFGCRMWSCRWLVNDDTGDLPRPDRAGYVIDMMPDFITIEENGEGPINIEVVQIWIDPKNRDAHRDPKLRAYLERRGQEGKAALIRFSESDAFVLWPPAMSFDRCFHELHSNTTRVTHSAEERFHGIATARRVMIGQ